MPASKSGAAVKGPVLTPFAQMVFENTNTPHARIQKPKTPVSRGQSNGTPRQSVSAAPSRAPSESQQPPKPRALQPIVQVKQMSPEERNAYQRYEEPKTEFKVEPKLESQVAPMNVPEVAPKAESSITPRMPQMAYVVPKALSPAQRKEYEFIPASSTPITTVDGSQNRTSSPIKEKVQRLSADQQRQANAAVENLQNQLQAIFEAEDYMQPDTSGEVSRSTNVIFRTCEVQGSTVPMMHSQVQDSLDAAFAKVVTLGRLGDIEVESLVRIQRLCETSVSAITSTSLRISDDWTEQDISEWLDRITLVKSGLVAARTMMRIMTGGSSSAHHKELQSEDNVKSILYSLRWVIDGCIIPVVGERSVVGERIKGDRDAPSNQIFVIAAEHRPQLQSLIKAVQKCLRLLGDLFTKTNIDETSISSAEMMCRTLIFGDNAPSEKEAALGIAVFETLRRASMDLIAKVFTKYDGQRQYIIDQILQSLEKLPATKQSARQFTLIDAKPIQLVSALLMRLVQTSATAGNEVRRRGSAGASEDEDADGSDASADPSEDDSEDEIAAAVRKRGRPPKIKPAIEPAVANANGTPKPRDPLSLIARPLYEAAQIIASQIVQALLQRALSTSKSSDEPFRKLLDIFTEDFLNVLGSSDWPSAEMLLRKLVGRLFGIAENAKAPAPSRSLALELLGTIGSSILDVRTSVQDYAKSLDASADSVSRMLSEFARVVASGGLNLEALVRFGGPYRVIIEYLHARGCDTDAQLQTARGYHLVQWAEHLNSKELLDSSVMESSNGSTNTLRSRILSMIKDPRWLEEDSEFANISTVQGKLAARLATSHLMLCRAFPRILGVLLKSFMSEQSTVRSRSIKSITFLLEKSSALLESEPHILDSILRASRDKSSLVRDSAIILMEKCLSLQPCLVPRVSPRIIERTTDASPNIRKRAIKFLKQLYLMIKENESRAMIANAVIVRVADSDETVAEAALTTIKEIWFSGFTGNGKSGVDTSLQLRAQVSLIIQTVEPSDAVASVLESMVKKIAARPDTEAGNLQACKAFMAVLFDGVIDSSEIPGEPPQWAILRTLTVFAKAAPRLFTASQLERLEPYAKNLQSQDDLRIFQQVITIFRYTFPHVSTISQMVLTNLQASLLKAVSRIPSSELAAVAPCLAAISSVLGSSDRLIVLIRSVLKNIYNERNVDLQADAAAARRVERLLAITGHFGNAYDFDPHLSAFQNATHCPGFKGDSVSAYMVTLCCRFTSPRCPLPIRAAAIEAVCSLCRRHPHHFLREDVTTAFKLVFADHLPDLEHVLLTSIAEFFTAQETPEEDTTAPQLGSGIESGTERLGNTYQATGLDSAFGVLAQTFLEDFLRIALAAQDEVAMAAARIVVSINRQGRATPRQSGYCLVALETCPNVAIAKMAFLEHKSQYSKHEGTFESDLPRSLEKTFKYQMNISETKTVTGTAGSPPVSKLHFLWEVLKTGKAKVRTKMFTSMCAKIGFDPNTFVPKEPQPERLLSARFSVEAMAFLEFERAEELTHLISCLEKTFSTTGTPVAQAIESEVQQLNVPTGPNQPVADDATVNMANSETKADEKSDVIAPKRLLQLAVFAQILLLLFETHAFLRRAWNMQKHATVGRPKKVTAKEASTKPNRSANYATLSDAYLNRIQEIMNTPADEAAQRAICNTFAETFKRDDEVKVGSDEDADGELDADGDFDARSDGGSSTKSGSVPLGTPRKRKRGSVSTPSGGPSKRPKARTESFADEDDDPDGDWD